MWSASALLRRRGNWRTCVWQWLIFARGGRWLLWRWRLLYAALRDATTKFVQAEYVLGMAPNKQELAARRVVPSKHNWEECVLLMVQGPNVAAMRDVPSRLSGEGSAKITLGLCRNISWFVQHRGVPQQWCLDKSEQNVGLQELPLHESHWKGSILGCKYTRTNVQL